MTLSNLSGAKLYAKIGGEGLAVVDTGSAKTLLDVGSFLPAVLKGLEPVSAMLADDYLLDASGDRIPKTGSWPAWVEGAGYGGCIGIDLVKGCPAKAAPGLDACRALLLAIVFTGADVELSTGAWRMVNVDRIQISALEKRQPSVGAVRIPTRRGTHTQRVSVEPRPQECPFTNLDDEQREAEAVRYLDMVKLQEAA